LGIVIIGSVIYGGVGRFFYGKELFLFTAEYDDYQEQAGD